MNSGNSKTSKLHVLILKLTNKLDLRIGEKIIIALSNLSIYYTWENIKSSYNNNKFKIPAPTWNDKFELPDGSYSVSDIQDYFEYILKKLGENTDKPSVQIYVNKIENRVTYKIKNGYSLELLMPETMKLHGSTKTKITKDKNGENVPHFEITEVVFRGESRTAVTSKMERLVIIVNGFQLLPAITKRSILDDAVALDPPLVLVHCNFVNNDYQQDSRVLYTFVPNKPFGSLLEVCPTNHISLKAFNSEYDEIIVWFTNQNSQSLEIENRINLTIAVK